MAKRLFVGNLPWTATTEELKEMFTKFGNVVDVKVLMDKYTGKSKGFGFIEFENDADADKAIETLNGSDFGGRNIVVNEARPMEQRN